jgi:HD-GYP domain-containing protein (c-di-GMP phosphodiesterase class II)/putative methionine-R-sulfoxide reductase with GAF domain
MELQVGSSIGTFDSHRVVDIIQRANQIAATTSLDTLQNQMLDLFIEATQAQAGTLYLYDAARHELIFSVVRGDAASQRFVNKRIPANRGIVGMALQSNQPMFIADVERDERWDRQLGELSQLQLETMYCLPLVLQNRPVGVMQVFNLPQTAVDDPNEVALLQLLANRMASEIDKARLLNEAQRREKRLSALVDIISLLTSTLERNQLLTLIMNHARELLEVEATSVWELDEQRNVLVLHVATGERGDQLKEITVPVGQGLIGECVRQGVRILVDDVTKDERHNKEVDRLSGFVSRSILSVPLRAPNIHLGHQRGILQESVIGGAQAINKCNGGTFSEDDIELFEALANQAATVLQLSRLYEETQKLFEGVIKVVAGAIDAKDPYTQGHSQRVSDFAVAIAEELNLPQEEIYHIKIGGILHDVGKIGVPDAILKKPGRLTEEEMAEMREHPTRGYEIMRQEELRWLLRAELPALLEHHERLDGNGYPQGLRGDEIQYIGRLVAVADVFDALTSDRPYRAGMPFDKAFAILSEVAGTELDPDCVAALWRARQKGKVLTQRERIEMGE